MKRKIIPNLLGVSQYRYSKNDYLPIGIGVTLSMKDCPKTHEVGEYITKVPYASTMRVIVYDMLFACSNIIYALGVTS